MFGAMKCTMFRNGARRNNPVQYDTYTKLLLHCDGNDGSSQFTDSSAVSKAVYAHGNARISTQQYKFGGTSLLLDGNDDYLRVPHHDDFNFGTGAFTIDFWFYSTNNVQTMSVFIAKGGESHVGGATHGWTIMYDWFSLKFFFRGTDYSNNRVFMMDTGVVEFPLNTWNHLAVVRNSNGLMRLYLNGIYRQSMTYTGSAIDSTKDLRIGIGYEDSGEVYGNMDEIRISKGIARWQENFIPLRSAYTNLPDEPNEEEHTNLLLFFDGPNGSNNIVDSSVPPKTVTVHGNAQLSTTKSVSGGSSLYIASTSDYLSIAEHEDFDFGTGDFTIDFRSLITAGGNHWFFQSGPDIVGKTYTYIRYNSDLHSLKFGGYLNDSPSFNIEKTDITLNLNTWYHFAGVRCGNIFTLYLNGEAIASGTYTGSVNSTGNFIIPSGTSLLYIDDFRVIKGLAKWTENFQP